MFEFHRQHPIATVTQFCAVIQQNIVPIIIFIVAGSRKPTGSHNQDFGRRGGSGSHND